MTVGARRIEGFLQRSSFYIIKIEKKKKNIYE